MWINRSEIRTLTNTILCWLQNSLFILCLQQIASRLARHARLVLVAPVKRAPRASLALPNALSKNTATSPVPQASGKVHATSGSRVPRELRIQTLHILFHKARVFIEVLFCNLTNYKLNSFMINWIIKREFHVSLNKISSASTIQNVCILEDRLPETSGASKKIFVHAEFI